ncbi:MAG: GTP 3',8-cyclase MoaA [Candidatus Aminicenantes bacterium]|nr:GTP 3',8-cyclase MoaA [Candidatus Aminicenantes bacterium]
MKDRFERQINYMRISVTDRCNLRCFYCRGVQDFSFIPHEEILTYEEILRLVRIALKLGIDRFRLTGGEPLVRKDIENLVQEINRLEGVRDLSLTTNGLLLPDYLEKLKAAGLKRLNISLDTLQADKYKKITGFDGLEKVLFAITRALELGFDPVKINVVLLKGLNEELDDFIQLAFALPVHIRFIELMEFSPEDGYFVSGKQLREKLYHEYALETMKIAGSGPARNHYRIKGMKGSFGFILPYSDHFCGSCNRLRLSADGKLQTCLFSSETTDLKGPLRRGAREEEIISLIKEALARKPGSWADNHSQVKRNGLRSIGG